MARPGTVGSHPMILLLLSQLLFAAPTPVPQPDDSFYLELVDDSFSAPLYVTAPEGDDRLFVVERGGRIKVVRNGNVLTTPYLDIRHLLAAAPGGEQGLLGLAFDPDFPTNGRLFVSYTDTQGRSIVARLFVDPSANSVDAAGLHTVIRVDQPAANHNGGMILFGPDGYLYFGLGDGGGGGDPFGNGQNKNTLLGAILRIDPDTDQFPSDPFRNYAIPPDNPFVGADGADEIWVYGLRNPWRFWIDEPTGRLYIADVGQGSREEVTILEPGSEGANLGWNRLEGSQCYPVGSQCSSAGTVLPQVEYSHSGGASITGGMVYRGIDIPRLAGTYFYADFVSGFVRSFRGSSPVTHHFDWRNRFKTNLVSSFGLDGRGEMYVASLSGSVWKIRMRPSDDEVLFYRSSGTFKYYGLTPSGGLSGPILSGAGYSPGWKVITSVDLDGDGQDELLFYRGNGVFKYYDVLPDGRIGRLIRSGTGYSHKWDSITAVDLDGNGRDEMFFYDRVLGLYAYYAITPSGAIGAPIRSGTGYSLNWDSITAIDLDGDGQDEMFFYRTDGSFRYYDVQPGGSLGSLIQSGTGYSAGWDSITAIDLDGDGQDEMFFYRTDGSFRYYDVDANGGLGSPIRSGTTYSSNWDIITGIDIDG